MKTGAGEALFITIAMAATIFFCRLSPFLFFRNKKNNHTTKFLSFIEKVVPPVAMTVLAFNALAGQVQTSSRELISALGAAVFTALVHIWRRNPLISIFGGTALFIVLSRVLEQ